MSDRLRKLPSGIGTVQGQGFLGIVGMGGAPVIPAMQTGIHAGVHQRFTG